MSVVPTPLPTPTVAPLLGLTGTSDEAARLLIGIAWALAVLVLAIVIARLARRGLVRAFGRNRVNLSTVALLGNLAEAAIILLGITLILPAFGLNWTGLVAVLGAVGLAISLSLQDILKNVFAGVYILLEQPFRIGDRITVKEVTGAVQGIQLRTTILSTDEGVQVIVPNNTVLTEVITNRSVSDLRKQIIRVELKRTTLSGTGQQIVEMLKGIEHVASAPAPVVALEGVTGGVATLRVEFWVTASDRMSATSSSMLAIQTAFPEANVTSV